MAGEVHISEYCVDLYSDYGEWCLVAKPICQGGHTWGYCRAPPPPPPLPMDWTARAPEARVASARIIGGDTVDPAFSMPFVMSLTRCSLFFCELTCGASLISARWAITAAHCMAGARGSVGVSVHRHRLKDWSEHECAEFIPVVPVCHPDFSPTTMQNDICLLQLIREPRCFRQMQHMVIDDGSHASVGVEATVAGWGATVFTPHDPSQPARWVAPVHATDFNVTAFFERSRMQMNGHSGTSIVGQLGQGEATGYAEYLQVCDPHPPVA